MFTRVVGIGAVARFSRGTVTLDDRDISSLLDPIDVKLGGFQVAAVCVCASEQPMSTPGQNLTLPPVENLTARRGDEPQAVATS